MDDNAPAAPPPSGTRPQQNKTPAALLAAAAARVEADEDEIMLPSASSGSDLPGDPDEQDSGGHVFLPAVDGRISGDHAPDSGGQEGSESQI